MLRFPQSFAVVVRVVTLRSLKNKALFLEWLLLEDTSTSFGKNLYANFTSA